MEIEGYNFPDELWYDKNHFWARIEGDTVVMGPPILPRSWPVKSDTWNCLRPAKR